ncbi:MAG TPA: hypothetical protein QGI40_02955 [Nitrospinaceae bacterium]|jgi:uncharacterized membrane protein|nr:hypothetical protein [Nitrospinaceae bacterium]HJL72799.1 hypothetical protein [Nitrospinaceae bacterium]HJO00300.1 hypothetical protein [Nitrospinaceae bacterium]|tara:strand:- start:3917 stop:4399 length:483 start_codon:yes stop_codon:yes gene_type:complete
MTNNIIIFIHLMAAAIAIGSMVFAVILLLPSVEKLPEHRGPEEHSIPYKSLEILAPTVFACLLALIGTGIYFLLENYSAQVELKPGYYDLFGIKLISVVAAFFLSIYQTFNLRTRIADLDLSPENRKLVPETIRQMKKITQFTLTAFSLAVFFGIWMARY